MSPRSIRRAAERRAAKLARKAERAASAPTNHPAAQPSCTNPPARMPAASQPPVQEPRLSEHRLAANRANARLSSGPRTIPGKGVSSLNALKTGLTGRTVLLPGEDRAAYDAHTLAYFAELAPLGQREIDLVRSISDTTWRLLRIPSLEAAIFVAGHFELKDQFEEHDADYRRTLIAAQTLLKYERQIRNLHLQESRLSRRLEKELAELRQLQQERMAGQHQTAASKADSATDADLNDAATVEASATQSLGESELGFEFSNSEFTQIESDTVACSSSLPSRTVEVIAA